MGEKAVYADFLKVIRNNLFRLFYISIMNERLEYHKASKLEGPFQFIQYILVML